jgi:hypothetical protein
MSKSTTTTKSRKRQPKPKYSTREEWLNACADALRPLFDEAGASWDKVRVSVGFPKGGRSGSSHAIGQCWAHRCSADEHAEIFISPELEDAVRVADVLAHELIHAAIGVEEGHKASTFGKVARAIGLEGKLTATVAGDELRKRLEKITKALGPYPHRELRGGVGGRRGPGGPLGPSGLPKQSTRLLKVACPSCGCIVRMTAKWLEAVGAPTCGCGEPMAAACMASNEAVQPRLMAEVSHRQMGEYEHRNLVRLIQPRCMGRIEETAVAGMPWAADNDGFDVRGPELGAAVWTDEKVARYVRMLDRLEGLPGCIFVTVPDVVGRADATLELFHEWLPALRERGLPPAFVAQDGAEDMDLPWDDFDALFIGGSTEWKEGPGAARLAREAKRRGKWVHWGRVNTRRRFDLIMATGACDSFDGSKFARWAKTYLRVGLGWTAEPVQLNLAA